MKTEIRILKSADKAGWAELRLQLWPECPAGRHKLEMDELMASPGVVVIARDGRTAVGFAEVSIRNDHVEGTGSVPVPYLEGWFVAPSHRGKGVGRLLIDFVTKWAMDRGFEEIASDTGIENETGILMHKNLGFSETSRTVHFIKKLKR